MSDAPQDGDWWLGEDGKWYPPVAAARSPEPPTPGTEHTRGQKLALLGVILAIVGWFSYVALSSDDDNMVTASEAADQLAASMGMSTTAEEEWATVGFSELNSQVAWRWASDEASCGRGPWGCWALEVEVQYGCSSLYAEVTVLDEDDRAIGYANDTIPGVKAGQRALLQFESYEKAAESARLNKITCR